MSWITLAEEHVLARLSSEERDNIESTGEKPVRDRLAGIITQVTALVRGKVAACNANLAKMGPAGTIPDELLWAAATIARNSLTSSLPISEGETDPRANEFREAQKMLSDAASCLLRIAGPDGDIPEATDGGAGVYGGSAILDF